MKQWSNWSGRVDCQPTTFHRPDSEAKLERIIDRLDNENNELRPVGSGHSFTPLARGQDHLVSLENLTGLTNVNREDQRVSVRAGTTLRELGQRLDERDLAMENLGDVDRQALAGALSTGTHGTGIDHGILSTQLKAIKLLSPAEGWLTCSETTNPDVFKAAQVSLGTLGILTELTLDLEPAYNLREVVETMTLSSCLDQLDELKHNNRHFEFFWFPGTETVLVKTLNRTDDSGDVPQWTYGEVIENRLFETACHLGSKWPILSPALNTLCASAVSTGTRLGPAHKIFATLRSVRFNEMEYAVPEQRGPEAFRRIKNFINREHPEVQFPVEFRFVSGDDIPLSPAYGRDRAFIAVHKYHRKSHETFFRNAEAIFREFDGRPHWGKIHYLRAGELKELYPEWDRFQAVRHRLDPNGLLLNDYLDELLST